jgi:hypothetical protein
LDTFPHPALDFRLVNFDAHGLPAVIVSQRHPSRKPVLRPIALAGQRGD